LREAAEACVLEFNTRTLTEKRGNVVDYVIVPPENFASPVSPSGPGLPQKIGLPGGTPGGDGGPYLPGGAGEVSSAGISIGPITELFQNPGLVIALGFVAASVVGRFRRK
jgi:hypothetical protein